MSTKLKNINSVLMITFFIVLMQMPIVFSNGAVAVVLNNDEEIRMDHLLVTQGCSIPVDYSLVNNCKLTHDRYDALNTFVCKYEDLSQDKITVDCKGNILSIENESFIQVQLVRSNMLMFSTIALSISMGIVYLIFWLGIRINS